MDGMEGGWRRGEGGGRTGRTPGRLTHCLQGRQRAASKPSTLARTAWTQLMPRGALWRMQASPGNHLELLSVGVQLLPDLVPALCQPRDLDELRPLRVILDLQLRRAIWVGAFSIHCGLDQALSLARWDVLST